LAEEGIPTELAYTGAKSTIRHIVSTNFAQGVEWGTLSKTEQKKVINQVKGAFRNGGELDSQWIADKISNSMSQARYHDRMKIRVHLRDLNVYRNLERPLQFSEDIWNAFYQSEVQLKATRQLKEITERLAKAKKARELGRSDRDLKTLELKLVECQSVVDEVGDPPLKFLKAAERVKLVPPTTHKLGQGGIPGLKAAFVSTLPLLHFFPAKIRIKLSFCRVK
jgi:predicted RNA-binding Zn ribbon-like protein